jgi:hypothetical protein
MSELYDVNFLDQCSAHIYPDKVLIEAHSDKLPALHRGELEHILREMDRARDGHYPCTRCNTLAPISECGLCEGTGVFT